jgi:hypothetical protein
MLRGWRLRAAAHVSDWSSNADPERLNELAHVVDEVVVQTHQGRRTIADYPRHLPRLGRLTVPFSAQPAFRGDVVFLQKRQRDARGLTASIASWNATRARS